MFTYENIKIDTNPHVYDPAEDTFLLLNSIEIDKGSSVFEIGTGCGVIALYCAYKGADVVCSDINPYAIDLTKKNYEMNKNLICGSFEVREGDLFSVLKENETFDLIIFNPPYLPTKKDELVDRFFDLAVDGGKDGLRIIRRFIKDVGRYLKKKGRAIFVVSSLSDIREVEKIINRYNLKYKVINKKNFDDETIYVFLVEH